MQKTVKYNIMNKIVILQYITALKQCTGVIYLWIIYILLYVAKMVCISIEQIE